MASQAATCELDVGAGRDGHVNVAKDRPCLNVNLVGRAVCVSEIDDHVAEERDGEQLVLDIPAPVLICPTAVATAKSAISASSVSPDR